MILLYCTVLYLDVNNESVMTGQVIATVICIVSVVSTSDVMCDSHTVLRSEDCSQLRDYYSIMLRLQYSIYL